MRKRTRVQTWLAMMAVVFCAGAVAAAPMYRPGREERTINTPLHEIVLQKNGLMDVLLVSGDAVFTNAHPMVWFDGAAEPEPLPTSARFCVRQKVGDALGEGQGFLLKYKETEWALRTYTTQPYLAVQAAYVNTSKKPVRVRALLPWCVGGRSGGQVNLGANTISSAILGPAGLLPERDWTEGTEALMEWYLAAHNRESGHMIVAGFLTEDRATTRLRLGRAAKGPRFSTRASRAAATDFSLFRAECVYDPPIEVPPGGRLSSEVLYISLTGKTPHEELERFGHAIASINGIPLRKPLVPYGWSTGSGPVSEQIILSNAAALDAGLRRYGWTHVSIDAGWARVAGGCEADPERFPRGMRPVMDEIHKRGMTVDLSFNPFLVSAGDPVLREHPDWAVPLENAQGVPDGARVLNVALPAVIEHVRETCRQLRGEWGFDALAGVKLPLDWIPPEAAGDAGKTTVEVQRAAFDAVREGLGPDTAVLAEGPPGLAIARLAHVMRVAGDVRQPDAFREAAHWSHLAPHLWAPDVGPVSVEGGNLATRSLVELTGLILTGGAVRISGDLTTLSREDLTLLRRMVPPVPTPATPADPLETDTPQVWVAPVRSDVGDWHIVGLFNWESGAPAEIPLDFASLGLTPGRIYAVFSVWENRYCGIARGTLRVTVPAASAMLVCLRPYEDRPMFLAIDSHFSLGATDLTSLAWDASKRTLSGALDGIENTPYVVRVLVPDGYVPQETTVSCGPADTRMNGGVLELSFECGTAGPVAWAVRF